MKREKKVGGTREFLEKARDSTKGREQKKVWENKVKSYWR